MASYGFPVRRQQAIASRLVRDDPHLARVFDARHDVRGDGTPDLYLDLLQSIISQQLSTKAADTIFRRFLDLFPGRRPRADRLLAMRIPTLRRAGVSRQKACYLKAVAAFKRAGGLDARRLGDMGDEQVIEHLTQIKGVGRWTAEMLLMFSLQRPDVFPVDDLGIQNAMKSLYGVSGSGPRLKRRLQRIAETWRPHRTLVCRHLWRWKDCEGL